MSGGGVILNPWQIESRSFAVIDAEAGEHGFDPRQQWPVVRRIVHTTADFDFVRNTRFSPGAIPAALAALSRGEGIFCDTRMVRAGISRERLEAYGCLLHSPIGDPDVAAAAAAQGVTRATVAVRKGVEAGCGIFLIGNAPTALFELLQLVGEGRVRPSLVVGVPVGFVGAEESKEQLLASDLPYILCRGRKGGSPVAAAILNALLILGEVKCP